MDPGPKLIFVRVDVRDHLVLGSVEFRFATPGNFVAQLRLYDPSLGYCVFRVHRSYLYIGTGSCSETSSKILK